MNRLINNAGVQIIKSFEGLEDGDPKTVLLDPYLCPANVWTIGWGHVIKMKTGHLIKGIENERLAKSFFPNGITVQEAEELLQKDVHEFSKFVSSILPRTVGLNAFSACTSLAFNIGIVNFKLSTLTKMLVRNEPLATCASQFNRWVFVNKKRLNGLVKRREAERKLFLMKDTK
jgi:lysozyme